ncbi:hypothetical protein B0H14DRAFT_3437723 [Mycena olivaceomarginata]|nr:hypothetical protein B0H14DRAFT_3437723 [Mycena olivaceomarginata]
MSTPLRRSTRKPAGTVKARPPSRHVSTRGAVHQDQTASDEELANDPDAEENEEEEEDELADDTTVTTVASPLKAPASKAKVSPPSRRAPAHGAAHEDQTASDEERANDPDAEENEEEEKDELADTTVTLPLKIGPPPKGAKKIGVKARKAKAREVESQDEPHPPPNNNTLPEPPNNNALPVASSPPVPPNNNTLPEPPKNTVPPVDDNASSEPPKGNTTPPNNANTSSESSENNTLPVDNNESSEPPQNDTRPVEDSASSEPPQNDAPPVDSNASSEPPRGNAPPEPPKTNAPPEPPKKNAPPENDSNLDPSLRVLMAFDDDQQTAPIDNSDEEDDVVPKHKHLKVQTTPIDSSDEEDDVVPKRKHPIGLSAVDHRGRNPLAPEQPRKPAKAGKASGTGSAAPNAVVGSKEAKAVVLREARAKLQEEIVKHKEEQAAKVERLAKELGLDRKEVEKKLRAATGLKSKRGHATVSGMQRFTGKPAGQRLRLPDLQALVKADDESSPMTEGESKVLLKEYGAYRDAIEKGTVVSNREAAKDVTWTVETIYDELLNLESRTGARFLLVVAGSNVNDTITPTCVGSEAAMPFCSSILKMSSTEYGTKFQAYAHLKDDALIEGGLCDKARGHLFAFSRTISVNAVAKKKLRIEYKNYEQQMMLKERVMLVGWPSKFEMRAPSNAGNGGSEMITELLTLAKAGKLYWAKVPEKEREELHVKYENAPPIARKRRGMKGKASEEDEDEEEDEEEDNEEDNEEEDAPKKKRGSSSKSAPKKSAHKPTPKPAPKPAPKKAASQAVTKKAASKSRKRKAPESDEEEEAQETDEEPAPKKQRRKEGSKSGKGATSSTKKTSTERSKKRKRQTSDDDSDEALPPQKSKSRAAAAADAEATARALEMLSRRHEEVARKRNLVQDEPDNDSSA